jgi:hypothetical protein
MVAPVFVGTNRFGRLSCSPSPACERGSGGNPGPGELKFGLALLMQGEPFVVALPGMRCTNGATKGSAHGREIAGQLPAGRLLAGRLPDRETGDLS